MGIDGNSDLPDVLQRIIVAHELGHSQLHAKGGVHAFCDAPKSLTKQGGWYNEYGSEMNTDYEKEEDENNEEYYAISEG